MQDILITPFKTGLVTSLDSWSMPDDAFVSLNNFTIEHGRLQKRFGRRFYGQMVTNAGAPSTERVMGISQIVDRTNPNTTVVNSKQYMNYWDGLTPGSFEVIDAPAPVWNAGNTDYYWYANWQPTGSSNKLYITNGLELSGGKNGIRYYDLTTPTVTYGYRPEVSVSGSTTITMDGCKMLFALSGRLVALYTIEDNNGNLSYHPQRARWSKYQNSLEANWNDTIAGNGDFVDAATGDEIISARHFKDGLVVFFSNSVWFFYPTGDPRIAFTWKRVNSYRACDGRMASQDYDDYVAGLGIRGIIASNGSQTQRIDDRIEDFANDTINIKQFEKVFCARSYQQRKWWSLYANRQTEDIDSVLIWNEDDKCWSTYSTDLNVLGYFVNSFDLKASDFTEDDDTCNNDKFIGLTCQSYNQDDESVLAGGDLNGNVYQLDQGGVDETSETTSNQISASFITPVLNPWKREGAEAKFLYVDFLVETDKYALAEVSFMKDNAYGVYKTEIMDFLPPMGVRTTIEGITLANPAVVSAFNHGLTTGDTVYIYGVQGFVNTPTGVDITPIDINSQSFIVTVIDGNSFSLDGVDASAEFSAYEGGGAIYRRQFVRTRVWKRVYAGGVSIAHQIKFETIEPSGNVVIIAYRPYFKMIGTREIN